MKKQIFLIFILIILISYVSADFGVVSQYYEGNPLILDPGRTIDTYFKIQNTVGDTSDLVVEVVLLNGSRIASITGENTYEVPSGEQKTVNIQISIPQNVQQGREYTIEALFRPVSQQSAQEGNVQFVVSVNKKFNVIVGEKTIQTETANTGIVNSTKPNKDKKGKWLWFTLISLIIVLIGILLVVVISIFRRKKIYGY